MSCCKKYPCSECGSQRRPRYVMVLESADGLRSEPRAMSWDSPPHLFETSIGPPRAKFETIGNEVLPYCPSRRRTYAYSHRLSSNTFLINLLYREVVK